MHLLLRILYENSAPIVSIRKANIIAEVILNNHNVHILNYTNKVIKNSLNIHGTNGNNYDVLRLLLFHMKLSTWNYWE